MATVEEQYAHSRKDDKLFIGIRDFFSGVFGGICGVVAGQPLDFVRVRMQTAAIVPESPIKVLTRAIQSEGPLTIWKGMASPILGVSFQNAITFVSYGQAMHFLSNGTSAADNLGNVWLAGTFAGLCQSVVVCPVELVKIKLQVQTQQRLDASFKGPWHCARLLFLRNGLSGLYQGFGTTVLRDSSSYGLYFWAYEAIKNSFPLQPNFLGLSSTSPLTMFFAGGIGGVVSWALCYPFDIVKTNMQADSIEKPRFSSSLAAFKFIYSRGGWRAFTVGLGTTCLRGFVVNGALFAGYEAALKVLSSFTR